MVKFDYNKNREWMEHLHIVMQIGLTMAGCIALCFAIGYYIDKWLGTSGIFITIFILLGIAGGANVVYRQIMEIINTDHAESENKDDHESGNGK